MSSPRRHGLPRKKPDTAAKQDIEAELPVLQPIDDDLPVLEPVEEPAADGPVKATGAAGEGGFAFAITVDVPAMDKKDVATAVPGPLQRVAAANGAQLRHQRVLVRFTGEGMVGSAIKEVVAGILKLHKPLEVVVRRGFGDEVVHKGELPRVEVETKGAGDAVEVAVATGDLEPADLAIAFAPHLPKVAAAARGKACVLVFRGAAKPDAELREQIGRSLREAGAVRAAIGERVLFDRELEDRVAVRAEGGGFVVQVTPAAVPATTRAALQLMLPDRVAPFAGKAVRIHFTAAAQDAELDLCIELCRQGAPLRLEVGDGKVEPDVVWPKLLEVSKGHEVVLRVVAGGRTRPAMLAAFRREVGEHAATLRGKPVHVDLPAGFAIDAEVERTWLGEVLGGAGPKSVVCTIGGEHREPFAPVPVLCTLDGGQCNVRLDTDAGKPAELLRAIERRLGAVLPTLRGKQVRVQVAGSAPPSRTLLRTLCSSIEGAVPARLEVEDHGVVDVLVPPLLSVEKTGGAVRIGAVAGGRDVGQQKLAMARELEGAAWGKDAVVTVVESPFAEALVAAVIARGAARVLLDGGKGEPVQVHPKVAPPPIPAPVAAPASAAVTAAPAAVRAAPAAAGGPPIRVLAADDAAVPPVVVLGIEAGDAEAHVAAVEQHLQQHLPRFQRRCVMLVLRKNGEDVPVRRSDALVAMLGRVVPTAAAATLVFRGPDAEQRPHFEVLHSTLRALPAGATFGDPRRR